MKIIEAGVSAPEGLADITEQVPLQLMQNFSLIIIVILRT